MLSTSARKPTIRHNLEKLLKQCFILSVVLSKTVAQSFFGRGVQ